MIDCRHSPVCQPLNPFNWSSHTIRALLVVFHRQSVVVTTTADETADSISTVIANNRQSRYSTTTTSWIAEVQTVDSNCGSSDGMGSRMDGGGLQRPHIYVKPLLNGSWHHRGSWLDQYHRTLRRYDCNSVTSVQRAFVCVRSSNRKRERFTLKNSSKLEKIRECQCQIFVEHRRNVFVFFNLHSMLLCRWFDRDHHHRPSRETMSYYCIIPIRPSGLLFLNPIFDIILRLGLGSLRA